MRPDATVRIIEAQVDQDVAQAASLIRAGRAVPGPTIGFYVGLLA
jgi:hypothetical protein